MAKICDSLQIDGKDMVILTSDTPFLSGDDGVRGVVYYGEDVIFKSFPYSYEYICTGLNAIADIEPLLKDSNVICSSALEGTLIRLFYFKNRWFTTTHRKLDAFKCKWGSSKSFGTMFKEAVSKFTDFNDFMISLDKEIQYVFLVTAIETTRVVCEPEPTIYLYTMLKDGVYFEDDFIIPKQKALKFNTIEEVYTEVSSLKKPFKSQGLLFFNKVTFESYKLVNALYQRYFFLRQNEPSVMFAYLHVFNCKDDVKLFKEIYPTYIQRMNLYNKVLEGLCNECFYKYNKKFVEKTTESYEKKVWFVLVKCNDYFKKRTILTFVEFERFFYTLPPTDLNKLIRDKISNKIPKYSGNLSIEEWYGVLGLVMYGMVYGTITSPKTSPLTIQDGYIQNFNDYNFKVDDKDVRLIEAKHKKLNLSYKIFYSCPALGSSECILNITT